MKIALEEPHQYILRFDKGEDVIAELGNFLAAQSILSCSFSGIGSTSEVELGYYNGHLKEYRKKPFFEELEVISLTGNGGIMEGKPAVHAHGMFGRTDFTTVGGHVFKLVVSATCEIFLTQLDGELKRGKNDEFNLNLLQ